MSLTSTNKKVFKDDKSVGRKYDAFRKDTSTWEIVRRIFFEHLLPHKKLLFVSIFALMFSAIIAGAIPKLIQVAADEAFSPSEESKVNLIALSVLLVMLIKASSEYVGKVTLSYLGVRFIASMRQRMFSKLLVADLAWMDKIHSGKFVSFFLTDANLVRQMASKTLIGIFQNATKVLALVVVMLWLNWYMTILILIAMPFALISMRNQRKKVRKATDNYSQETGELGAFIIQTVRNMRVVRAYGQQETEKQRAETVIDRAMEFILRGERSKAVSGPVVEALAGIGLAIAIYFAGAKGFEGGMTIGEFTGFMAATMLIYQPLKSLALLQTTLQEGVSAASRIYGIIDQPDVMRDKSDAKDLTTKDNSLTFDDVSFSYEEGNAIIKHLNLEVKEGQTVALVGPSGSGKSTVLSLILRFYDPSSGKVCIGGQDISKVTLSSVRERVAFVTQDPVLFNDTIAANIAYGYENASQEDIEKAARSAAAHDFIMKQSKGYETSVQEAGSSLSGGEKQRIAIARAFLRDAPILLLDEPTSALDAHSEEIVQRSLDGLLKGRTVLVIAHRLSTIKKADMICVLDKGRIVERGNHDDLLKVNGFYARLYAKQYGEASPVE